MFFGALAKLRKATVSFARASFSIRASVCLPGWNNSAPTGRIFMKFDIWVCFASLPKKIKVSLKSENNNEYCTRRTDVYLWYLTVFLKSETFQTNVAEEIKTRNLCSINFSRNSCRLWDDVEKCGRVSHITYDNIIRRFSFPFRGTKATDTLSKCNTYCVSTVTMITLTRLYVTVNVHYLSRC